MNGSLETSGVTRNAVDTTFDEVYSSTYSERGSHSPARNRRSQVLKRRFGALAAFGFSCCILATWETVLVGGPAALAWGFPIAWLSSFSVYLCLAEMASISPVSGGQYFWVAILAPQKYKRFCSYLTVGWLTSLAWIATLAVGSISTAMIIQGLIILNYPDYKPQSFHGTLLSWAVIAMCIFANIAVARLLPLLDGLILLVHILGFIAILTTLVYLSPHSSAYDVFFHSLNIGHWPSQSLSYLVGFTGNVAAFVGADAAVHMAEEMENPAINVPRAIIITVLFNSSTGWGMVLAILFCLGDINSVLTSPTGIPFIEILYNGAGKAGATAMTIVIIATILCAVIGFATTASRMVWSFAKDRGLPFYRFIQKVHPRTRVPVVAIAVVTLIPCLLNLIYIGSLAAFNDVISLSVSGLYASYLIPCSFLLWRRVTGQIRPHRVEEPGAEIPLERERDPNIPHQPTLEDNCGSNMLFQEKVVEWGPWRIPGLLGILNNTFACLFCVWVLFWDFWPPETPPTTQSMNYCVVVTGSVIIFAIARYFLGGKAEYRGPLVNYEVKAPATSPD
ncbi:amino acid/polyamine transporter I [Xylaria cf. heliscus]|nr:amino acid/polyamine transporter I [Xylaria cf. heliscus]